MPCERPSNGCRRAVERRVAGEARRCETRCQEFQYRVSRRNRIAPPPDDHGRHSGVPRAVPVIIPPRPFPGSDGSTVARSSSLKSNPATVAAFSRRRTGNPNERRENDEPGSRPDGNSDWILIHALSMPRIEAGRHRPIAAAPHPIQHRAHHRRIHNHRKSEKREQRHLAKVFLRKNPH